MPEEAKAIAFRTLRNIHKDIRETEKFTAKRVLDKRAVALLSNDKILKAVAQDAKDKRGVLIQKFKDIKTGNHIVDLVHGFQYTYGVTIPDPQILFPNGFQVGDWEFWETTDKL